MTAAELVLAAIAAVQVVALAWIAAWQARAAHEVRKLNGTILEVIGAHDRDIPIEAPADLP